MEFYSGFETQPKNKRAKKVATETMEVPSQDTRLYSEEEVLEILEHHTKYLETFIYQYIDKNDMEENKIWFNQFKKK